MSDFIDPYSDYHLRQMLAYIPTITDWHDKLTSRNDDEDWNATIPMIMSAPTFVIPESRMDFILNHAKQCVCEKVRRMLVGQDMHFLWDRGNLLGRFFCGTCAEIGCEMCLGVKIVVEEYGEAKNFHHPDVSPVRCGVKASGWGIFPLIGNTPYAQIVCVVNEENGLIVVRILGLYSAGVLLDKKNSDPTKYLNRSLKENRSKDKWPFVALDKGVRFNDLQGLKVALSSIDNGHNMIA